ncbi:MAG: Gfo/Idh/MocA family oxidoreductase [Clostridiales bacterium]|jgi:predicted dehydrogenase|nr:Gfo/Idh/MocA family oxidoreductase [Clostridiales bacterium]
MIKRHNIGIIGFGGMGKYHHACFSDYGRAVVAGIYDIDEDVRKDAESKGIKVYSSQLDMLDDPEIDCVILAVPNNFHKVISIESLRKGKNVLCEKPVTINSRDLLEIMGTAKETGKVFTIDQNRRTNKDFVLVKDSISKGLLGDPYFIESRVCGSRGIPGGWRCVKELGGGMMLDWGVHLIDQMMYMIPERVVDVYCRMTDKKYGCDDNFKLLINFSSGINAHIEVGTNNFIQLPRWYVCGTEGTLQIDDWDCNGKIIRAKDSNVEWEEEIVYTKAGPTKTMAPRSISATEEIILSEPDAIDSVHIVYDQFLDCVEGRGPLTITPEQALRVLKVMEAAFESNRIMCSVKVEI